MYNVKSTLSALKLGPARTTELFSPANKATSHINHDCRYISSIFIFQSRSRSPQIVKLNYAFPVQGQATTENTRQCL